MRIMRRGFAGAILNSKSEFDRCWIPRLVLDDKEDSEEEGEAEIVGRQGGSGGAGRNLEHNEI